MVFGSFLFAVHKVSFLQNIFKQYTSQHHFYNTTGLLLIRVITQNSVRVIEYVHFNIRTKVITLKSLARLRSTCSDLSHISNENEKMNMLFIILLQISIFIETEKWPVLCYHSIVKELGNIKLQKELCNGIILHRVFS